MKPHRAYSRIYSTGVGASKVIVMLALAACSLSVVSCPVVKADTGIGSSRPSSAGSSSFELADSDNGDDIGLEDHQDDGGVDVGEESLRDEERSGRVVPLDPEPLSAFFEALDRMEETGSDLVRIVHYGDSHTAADFMTTEVRRGLQERFGDGGRGFVLLGKPWRSYRPKDVDVTASGNWDAERILVAADPATLDGMYGLGGISVETDVAGSWARVSTSRATGYGRSASSFEVFYLAQPGGGSFRVLIDGVVRATVNTAATSPEEGFLRVDAPEGGHRFELRVKGDGNVRLFGGVIENDGPGVVYDTLGVNGGFFYTPLRWDAELLASNVRRRDPNLLVTMYGTNEVDSRSINPASYKRKVVATMERLTAGATNASCLMLGPPDRMLRRSKEGQPSQLDWIIDTQREVADEIGCAFLDLREMMGGTGSQKAWSKMRPALAQKDGIHLTVLGYRELGEQITRQLVDAYEKHVEDRSSNGFAQEE